jgi:L,D-transpeptidase ErfK/SrfK
VPSALSRRACLLTLAGLVPGLAAISAAARTAAPAADDIVGELTYHVTRREETLLDLARERDVGILELSAANPGFDPWIPEPESLVTLPTAHVLPDAPRRGLIINLAELRLYFIPEEGGTPVTHPIGVGRDGYATPLGATKIVRKQQNPTWYPTASKLRDEPHLPRVVPPGPDNPLGAHALYLGWPTYLVHGTNKPYGVGRRVSRGCIRMYPEDAANLFELVPVGTPVLVLDQAIKLGWRAGELFLEAHPTIAQLDELEERHSFPLQPPVDIAAEIVAKAGEQQHRVDWRLVEAELVSRRGIPVQITASADATAQRSDPAPAPSRSPAGPVPGIY